MIDIVREPNGSIYISDGQRRSPARDSRQAEMMLGLWGHAPEAIAPALSEFFTREPVKSLNWDVPIRPEERDEFKTRVRRLLDERSLPWARVAGLCGMRSTHELKEALGGAPILHRHLVRLRAYGPSASDPVPAEAAATASAAEPVAPAEPPAPSDAAPALEPIPSPAPEPSPPRSTAAPAPSQTSRRRGRPKAAAPAELRARADRFRAEPASAAEKRAFSVLAYWLEHERGLGRGAVARAAGLGGGTALQYAIHGSVSLERIQQFRAFVADLGVSPDEVVRTYADRVPPDRLPVDPAAGPPRLPDDSPARVLYLEAVDALRGPPWQKPWPWLSAGMRYAAKDYARRIYYTPGGVPDTERLDRLVAAWRELQAQEAEPAESRAASDQLELDGEGLAATAPPRPRAAESPPSDGRAATAPPPADASALSPAIAPAASFADLPTLFAEAADDLQRLCEKLGRIAAILPPLSGASAAVLREELLEKLPLLLPQAAPNGTNGNGPR